MRAACVLLVLVALGGPTAAAPSEGAWKELTKDGGILVEARPMQGTALREIRVRTHSLLEPEAIFAVIWNVSEQHEFVPNVKELKVLRASDEEVVLYERITIPIVQDRDYVLRLTKRVDERQRTYEVVAEGRSELGPPPAKGVVRMTRLSSRFTVTPAPEGGSLVTYVSFGDPTGNVPSWIIRTADVRGPRDFVRAILRRAETKSAAR